MIAALFVQSSGCYMGVPDVDPWPEARDARKYPGPYPVVAHPPCQLWGNLGALNYARWGGEHNRPGNDGGCFASALASVRRWGGVLEHPAFTKAWPAHGLVAPVGLGWTRPDPTRPEYVCEVWQNAYGHLARKRTWLFYVGPEPFDLLWTRKPGTHQVGQGWGRKKPALTKAQANATPPAFRDALILLARPSQTAQ